MIRIDLKPDERLLWSGQPKAGLILRTTDIFYIPFSLMWGGFAFFWEALAIKSGAPLLFALWGIPFVLVGLYVIVGRFVYEAIRRSRTYYAVTTQAVVIMTSLFGRSSNILNLRTLTNMKLDEGSDGWGTISFGPRRLPWFWGWPFNTDGGEPQFDTIRDAKKVYEIIRDAMQQAS